MSALTTWQTDDPCPGCGAHLIEISGPSSDRVIQQCRACAIVRAWLHHVDRIRTDVPRGLALIQNFGAPA